MPPQQQQQQQQPSGWSNLLKRKASKKLLGRNQNANTSSVALNAVSPSASAPANADKQEQQQPLAAEKKKKNRLSDALGLKGLSRPNSSSASLAVPNAVAPETDSGYASADYDEHTRMMQTSSDDDSTQPERRQRAASSPPGMEESPIASCDARYIPTPHPIPIAPGMNEGSLLQSMVVHPATPPESVLEPFPLVEFPVLTAKQQHRRSMDSSPVPSSAEQQGISSEANMTWTFPRPSRSSLVNLCPRAASILPSLPASTSTAQSLSRAETSTPHSRSSSESSIASFVSAVDAAQSNPPAGVVRRRSAPKSGIAGRIGRRSRPPEDAGDSSSAPSQRTADSEPAVALPSATQQPLLTPSARVASALSYLPTHLPPLIQPLINSSPKKSDLLHRLFPELDPSRDIYIDDYTCTLQTPTTHNGRLYLSLHHMCFTTSSPFSFNSQPMSMIVRWSDVIRVERRMQGGVLPTSAWVVVKGAGGEEVGIGVVSLWKREVCLGKMGVLMEAAREVGGGEEVGDGSGGEGERGGVQEMGQEEGGVEGARRRRKGSLLHLLSRTGSGTFSVSSGTSSSSRGFPAAADADTVATRTRPYRIFTLTLFLTTLLLCIAVTIVSSIVLWRVRGVVDHLEQRIGGGGYAW